MGRQFGSLSPHTQTHFNSSQTHPKLILFSFTFLSSLIPTQFIFFFPLFFQFLIQTHLTYPKLIAHLPDTISEPNHTHFSSLFLFPFGSLLLLSSLPRSHYNTPPKHTQHLLISSCYSPSFIHVTSDLRSGPQSIKLTYSSPLQPLVQTHSKRGGIRIPPFPTQTHSKFHPTILNLLHFHYNNHHSISLLLPINSAILSLSLAYLSVHSHKTLQTSPNPPKTIHKLIFQLRIKYRGQVGNLPRPFLPFSSSVPFSPEAVLRADSSPITHTHAYTDSRHRSQLHDFSPGSSSSTVSLFSPSLFLFFLPLQGHSVCTMKRGGRASFPSYFIPRVI